jgi:hypothetical protein
MEHSNEIQSCETVTQQKRSDFYKVDAIIRARHIRTKRFHEIEFRGPKERRKTIRVKYGRNYKAYMYMESAVNRARRTFESMQRQNQWDLMELQFTIPV